MDTITIYQKPTCSKCRETMKLLESKGIDLNVINYFIDPIPSATLHELIGKLGIKPIDLFRKKEERFQELEIASKNYSDEELIEILAANPELIERPIVVRGNKAVLGRPPVNVLQLF
jgi:arsenate reductase (glutaredoxin)